MKFLIIVIFSILNTSMLYAADTTVLNRLERLENDINYLQRKVYQGSNNPINENSSISVSGYADSPSINDIEDTIRKMKGDIEEISYGYKDLKDKLQKISEDVEYRLKIIESSVNLLDNNTILNSNEAAQGSNDEIQNKKEESKKNSVSDKAKQVDNKQRNNVTAKPVKLNHDSDEVIGTTTPQEIYDNTLSLVKNEKYDEAVAQWKEFIEKYPDNKLTSNAYYWYGESLYALKRYDQSSIQFLRGYKKFPKGEKAPETLLKLSSSLYKINKKQEACTALIKIKKEYIKLNDIMKKKIQDQYKSFNCDK